MTLKVENHMLENERRREGKKVTTQPVPQNELQMDQIFNWKFKTTGGFYNAAVEILSKNSSKDRNREGKS